MSVHPDTPSPLREAVESMERHVDTFEASIMFASFDMRSLYFESLKHSLAEDMFELYQAMRQESYNET